MAPGAATSPMVASNLDGRGAVYGSVVTVSRWQATRYDKGSPVVPISLTDFPFFWEGSVIHQVVYELRRLSCIICSCLDALSLGALFSPSTIPNRLFFLKIV